MRQYEVLLSRVQLLPVAFPCPPPALECPSTSDAGAGAGTGVGAQSTLATLSAHSIDDTMSQGGTADDQEADGAPPPPPQLELRLGLSIVEQRRMLRLWEAPREAAECAALAASEAETKSFYAALHAERQQEAATRLAMADADKESRLLSDSPVE